MTFKPPRLVRLPAPELAERGAALFAQAGANWSGPELLPYWGRPVMSIGIDVFSAQPLQIQLARTQQVKAAANDFYQEVLGILPPESQLWTVHLSQRLVMVAPVQYPQGTPLLWPVALLPTDESLDAQSRVYLHISLISQRISAAQQSVDIALALTLPNSEDERLLQAVGFRPFGAQ